MNKAGHVRNQFEFLQARNRLTHQAAQSIKIFLILSFEIKNKFNKNKKEMNRFTVNQKLINILLLDNVKLQRKKNKKQTNLKLPNF